MQEKIQKALSGVKYPGFDKDIVTLGMVEEIALEGGVVAVTMKYVSSEDVKASLTDGITAAISPLGVKVQVQFPPSSQTGPSQQAGGQQPGGRPASPSIPPKKKIEGVKNIIPVASGKGGVGKSTTSVNLAVALSLEGYKVGLLDLDVYGPSMPMMLGLKGNHTATPEGKLIPTEKHGLKIISLGLMLDEGAPLIWRGPLVARIVQQMFYDVKWGGLDYLIMDLPPGTGDVQLSLVQSVPITGAIVVTTPQDVALADAVKAINMFERTETKVLGIIENMSTYVCPHCAKESSIFGSGGGKAESERRNIPLLGEIPIDARITETCDSGEPVVLSDKNLASKFREIALRVVGAL